MKTSETKLDDVESKHKEVIIYLGSGLKNYTLFIHERVPQSKQKIYNNTLISLHTIY